MTATPDPIGDIDTLPGGQLMAACIGAVEHEYWIIRHRQESAAKRGLQVDPEELRRAAFLAGASEMLAAMRNDGDHAVAAGRTPPATIARAVSAARAAFKSIDRGMP